MATLAAAALAFGNAGSVLGQTSADFGAPPSGKVPIIFNDRHVYAKPDFVRRNRLLVALIKGETIYVPLRSMMSQLGATVAYDAETETVTVHKPGSTARLRVDVPAIVLDGETRPLDVPPVIIHGIVMVPLRVIAETMGAYVAYLPTIHAVVVRYVPVSPGAEPAYVVPTSAETAAPKPGPRATVPPGPPIPVSTPAPETYIVVDVSIAPSVDDAYHSGRQGGTGSSFSARAATEFSLVDVPLELDADFTQWAYDHDAGRATNVGTDGIAYIPAFRSVDRDLQLHFGAQLTPHKYYLSVGYLAIGNNYGYPGLGGLGAGIEKLPVLENKLSYDGSFFYYPNVSGGCNASCPPSTSNFSYKAFTFRAGLTYDIKGAFLDAGFNGDREYKKVAAPSDVSHSGVYVGLGLHF